MTTDHLTPRGPPRRNLIAVALVLIATTQVALAFPFFVAQDTSTVTSSTSTEFSFGMSLASVFDPVDMYFSLDNVLVAFQDSTADGSFDPFDIASITLKGPVTSRSLWRTGEPGDDPDGVLVGGPYDNGEELNGSVAATWDFEFTYSCAPTATGSCINWDSVNGYFEVNSSNHASAAAVGTGTLKYASGPDLASTPGINEPVDCFGGANYTDCTLNLAMDSSLAADAAAYRFFPNFPGNVPVDPVLLDDAVCPTGFEAQCAPYVDDEEAAPPPFCCEESPETLALADPPLNPLGGAGAGPIIFGPTYGAAPDPGHPASFSATSSSAADVPAPGTLALASLSVFSLAAFRRRRWRWG